ncbi:DUF3298 and DUF4163 domain-containing protein [Fredinandcohnia quinoae]|uniref:DUF3298 and DUF4163 domain-containing protein n=1 Tax=Fredinandcohnia quinoae TaxID=2918902 RepID=A0AAW5E7I7_9BACI|nr:DUF3298 and DUF4163 domain-containing protein [Fredinandcohnia sp. SECRCQ15]MCH1626884.1 DUF3298 and DUF4163 domain-containing protein [Fredinandcohnia sp. SECRCQ15]
MNDMEKLKNEYKQIPIPKELDQVVNKALSQKLRKKGPGLKWVSGIAAAAIIFISAVNVSPSFANAMANVPGMVKIVNLVNFTIDEERFHADVKVPEITNLENEELQATLNEKYLKENQQLYDQFMKDMEELKAKDGGNIGIDSDYQVLVDNDKLLTIKRTVVHTAATANEVVQFDTIDKKNQVLLTLPSLFKDDQYVNVISENIKEQMLAQMKADPNKIYWVKGAGLEMMDDEDFKSIAKDQSFYINNNGKLMISFDEYEVAPGYMGAVSFEIPTEVINAQLVSHEYIK